MKIPALLLTIAFAVSGCASPPRPIAWCSDHKVVCGFAGVLAVGAVTAVLNNHHDRGAVDICGPGRRIHPEAPFYGDCH